MSAITWNNNRLIQSVGNDTGELGYVDRDENSGAYVLWLKDTCGVLDLNGGYIRGDEFASLEDARRQAASAPSAFILHYIWLRQAITSQAVEALEKHWDEITPQLNGDVEKENVRDRLAGYLKRAPISEIKQLSRRIGEGLITNILIEVLKRLLLGG